MINKYVQTYDKAKLAKMNEKFRDKKGISMRTIFYVVSLLAIVVFKWF